MNRHKNLKTIIRCNLSNQSAWIKSVLLSIVLIFCDGCSVRDNYCGNGVVDLDELCDISTFTPRDCNSVSGAFSDGQVSCKGCTLDFSQCRRAPASCGNSVIEGAEQCDDGNQDDSDDCTNQCQSRVNGSLSFIEPPMQAIGITDAILDPNMVCASVSARNGYRARQMISVRYRIHLCQFDGTNNDVVSLDGVRALLSEVRLFYRQAGINLEEADVVRFQYQNCAPLYEDNSFRTQLINNTPRGIMPIAFVASIPSTTSAFSIGGYARFKGLSVNAGLKRTIVTHELGHFFGLAHTHACNNGRETITMCASSGDLFCDTPIDRGPRGVNGLDQCSDGLQLNGACNTNGCGIGSCDDGSRPDRDNTMSYYHCWPAALSNEQADFVRCTMDNELKTFKVPGSEVALPPTPEDNLLLVDYDGDRRSDIFLYKPGTGKAMVVRSNIDGTFATVYRDTGIAGFDFSRAEDRAIMLDYNGDGMQDLFFYRPGGERANAAGAAYLAKSKGNGSFETVYGGIGLAGFDLAAPQDRVLAFDYNGDGKQDLLLYRPGGERAYAAGAAYLTRSNGDGTFTTVYGGIGLAGFDLSLPQDRILAFDYNGDGKQDLLLYRPGGEQAYAAGLTYLARSNGDGSFTTVYNGIGLAGFDLSLPQDQVLALDYNGDGKQDLLLYRPGGEPANAAGAIYLARSIGDGTFFTAYGGIGLAGFDLAAPQDRVLAFDYNGDGKQDLLFYRPGGNPANAAGAVYLARSNGDGTFTAVYGGIGLVGFNLASPQDRILAFDYDKDGRQDLFLYRPGGAAYLARSKGDGSFSLVYTTSKFP